MRTIEKPALPAGVNGHAPATYRPVTVEQQDTVGAIFLGILSDRVGPKRVIVSSWLIAAAGAL